jgi:hypothetical protein
MATTIFSIQTPQDSRPYFNRLRFLAYDFEHWGYSVTEHESDSEYVRETRQRNNYIGLADARPSLWEVWAQEVVKQRQLNQAPPAVSDTCLHRVSEMLHDFVWALATQGKLEQLRRLSWNTARCLHVKGTPLPTNAGLNLVALVMRLCTSGMHVENAHSTRVPGMVVSYVELRFRGIEWLGQYFVHAAEKVTSGEGQWVKRPEMDQATRIVKVQMAVDIKGCVDAVRDQGEDIDPLPLYESVEQSLIGNGEGESEGNPFPLYESLGQWRADDE